MSRTRDYRRQQYAQRKKRFRKVFEGWYTTPEDLEDFITPFRLGFTANTPHSCSCYMCGNPRKWWLERTRQELRSELDEKEYAQVLQLVEGPVSKSGK